KDATVLAGHKGMENKVLNATFIDAPDGYDWCKEGDFIITTGYPFVQDHLEEGLMHLLKILVEKNCSGIGIKLGRYIPSMPSQAITFAEQNNLPIISLPNQLSWSDIIYPIVSRINKKQLRELENTHQVYEQFHQHLKKQGDLQDIAQLLHSFQEVPVTIFLRDFNQIVSTEEIITSKNEIENIISNSLSGTDQAIQRINWKKRDIAVKWIFNSDTLEGGIFLWGINSEFTTWRKAAIEQAAAIVALKIERLKAVSATFQRFRNEFISNLLESENVEQDVLLRRAKEMDWELKNNYKVLILDCYFMNQTEKTNLSTWKQKNNLLELLKSKLIPLFPEILLGFDRNNHFALLITDTINTNNFLHELGKVTFNLDIMQMIGGIGRLKTVVDLKSSYKEANLSLRVAHKQYINSNNFKDKRKSQPFIKSFSDLIVERIIFSKNPK